MAKVEKVEKVANERWNVSYTASEKNSGDDIKSISMGWENRSPEEVMKNLNIWLMACGYPLKVIAS